MQKVIIVVGPTASGKTFVGIQLAKKFGGEIISCDSMQIYRQLDIGTAKVKPEEKEGIKHHLIDIINPEDEFSVNDFRDLAFQTIEDLHRQKKIPILVGGTGLYINSIIYKLQFANVPKDPVIRKKWEGICREKGSDYLYNYLYTIDPKSCDKIHPNNTNRLIRAIEVHEITGKKFSSYTSNFRVVNDEYEFIKIGLTDQRHILYERINQRVDQMFDEGLIEEVHSLLDIINKDSQSMQAIGYKEVLDFFSHKTSYSMMKEKIKQNSRRYAKRQLTWFRRDDGIRWFSLSDYDNKESMVNSIIQCIGDHI